MKNTEKPSKNLKAAACLVASAAAVTVAAMAYKVNEEKVNASVDKAADKTKVMFEKASKKMKELADELVAKIDEAQEAEADVPEEADIVDVAEEDLAPVEEEAKASVPTEQSEESEE